MAEPIYDAMGNFTGVYADETPQEPAGTQDNPDTSNTGTTQAGSPGTSGNDNKPGKRPFNPLSGYSSYTYQISLYMITPDAYDVFVKNNRRNIEVINNAENNCGGGAYLICQSGGINNITSMRAPGFHYDYYIDNLVIDSVISPDGNYSPTTNVKMTFNITEPYGFSFISNLKRAKAALEAYSKTINWKEATNTSRQFFIMGIRFLGYDASGEVVGEEGTFERFYDILFTKVDFKIDGRTTTYQITAVTIPPTISMNQKRGVIDKGATGLTGNTVETILNKLTTKLNNDQAADVKSGSRGEANTYNIVFVNEAQTIAKSSIVNSADVQKIKWPMAMPKSKSLVNDNLSVKSQPNSQERIVSFTRDTPILQAINSVISQSDFLIKGLKAVYTTDTQPDAKKDSYDTETINSNKTVKWYNVSSVVSNARFDTKIKDYAFDIEYQIRMYETPIVLSAYADKTTEYYGPVKRYDYWWTGENSEVIRYEQSLNNAYFTVALQADGITPEATGGAANVPIALAKRQPVDRLGKLDLGKEAQNNYVTSIIDPGSFANAKIEILGDPDWLSNDNPPANAEAYQGNPFYGPDGFSIDPKAGQVFIEIAFKEAIDYDHNVGLMNINQNVLFWDYPPKIQQKLKGAISYRVIQVKSMFRGGKFTQLLECAINTFGFDTGYADSTEGRAEAAQEAENASEMQRLMSKGNPPAGLKPDPVPSAGSAGGDACGPSGTAGPTNQETTNEGVANDDSSPPYVDAMGNYYGGGR